MIKFDSTVQLEALSNAIEAIKEQDVSQMRPSVDQRALEGIKFVDCLHESLAIEMLEARLGDPEATQTLLGQTLRFVI